MGEWVIGAIINLCGSIAINFGTNLLKLGHDERERHIISGNNGANGKAIPKTIIYFQTWRVGFLFFAFGNCLNFISFGYAAQSLLAALGSVQFVSNIAFACFVLKKTVSIKYAKEGALNIFSFLLFLLARVGCRSSFCTSFMTLITVSFRVIVATAFIVVGNIFLVAYGNHQSPVYTTEQLEENYSNITFLLYCLILVLIVALHHSVYRRGELLFSLHGNDLKPYWHMLLPFSYAIVSGAVGSCSVLFAKSLSNLLRLSIGSGYHLHSWFTYSMLLLFLSTAGFWMARLNEGLSLFDAILIVPMFQIAWTFFSICTGFVYFQEYQVFDALRTTMFVVGMVFVFVGISLLAPDESKGGELKDDHIYSATPCLTDDVDRMVSSEDSQINDFQSLKRAMSLKAADLIAKAKGAWSMSFGLGEHSVHASSVLAMPMVSSRITGFRGSLRGRGWSKISVDEDDHNILAASSILVQSID